VYVDNNPCVAGVEVEIKKAKRYDDDEGGMDQGRGKEKRKKENIFFILKKKRYEDQLGSKLEQQPFPGNGARKLVGYFNDCKINPQAHGYRRSFHP
jgi:hypothetical protein